MNVSIHITDATPPEILGPNGVAGAATSMISVDEMTSGTITTFSATDASNVVWSLGAGNEAVTLLFRRAVSFCSDRRRHLRMQRMMRRLMITSRMNMK